MCYAYNTFKSFCVVPLHRGGSFSMLTQSFCQTFSYTGNFNKSDIFGPSLEDIKNKLTNVTLAKNFKLEVNINENNKSRKVQLDIRDFKAEVDETFKHTYSNKIKWAWIGYKINNESESDLLELDDSQIHTVEDCIHACVKSDSINCLAASYCTKGKGNKCILGGFSFTEDHISISNGSLIIKQEADEQCNIYKRSFVYHYDVHYKVSAIFPYEKMVQVVGIDHCAQLCQLSDFGCKSFEICNNKCYLRKEHFLDIHETVVVQSHCELYSCECYSFLLLFIIFLFRQHHLVFLSKQYTFFLLTI